MLSNCVFPSKSSWLFLISSVSLLFLWITSVQGQEMSRRRTSNVCRQDADCPNYAYCEHTAGQTHNGQCVCNAGFIIIANNGHRNCYRVSNSIGDACMYNEQCMITLSTESECSYGRCQCQNGTHFVQKENACYKSVRIGDFCRLTNNCIGEGTVCRSGICRCPFDTHPNFDMTNCIPDVQLGKKCENHDECVAENTRCYDICRCKVSHVISKDNSKCLKAAVHIYDNCEENHQCTENIPHSECSSANQTCMCRDGYHELNYKCWVSVPLGRICEVDENCALIQDAICVEGRCTCRDHLKIHKGICSSSIRILFSQRVLALIVLTYYLFIVA